MLFNRLIHSSLESIIIIEVDWASNHGILRRLSCCGPKARSSVTLVIGNSVSPSRNGFSDLAKLMALSALDDTVWFSPWVIV